ncbi:MAG: hypothetical protein K2J80_07455 [Oscillospiraceae bacterium]|nr:hypothetical protein [Oscillospiraceae bacterium]
MLIKIIRGTYGLNSGGSIKPKTCNDPPFDVELAEAKRLVQLGVAEIVGSSEVMPTKTDDGEPGAFSETPPDIPAYSEDNTNAELQSIAKEYGVKLPSQANKATIIAALDDYFNDIPDISVKEPE